VREWARPEADRLSPGSSAEAGEPARGKQGLPAVSGKGFRSDGPGG
jgi:hypothetical protein